MNTTKKILINLLLLVFLNSCSNTPLTESAPNMESNPLVESPNVISIEASSTPSNQATPIEEKDVQSFDTLFLMEDIGSDIFINDLNTGEIKEIGTYWHFGKWHTNGCYFLVDDVDGNIQVMDLNGNIVQTLFEYEQLSAIASNLLGREVFISPNNEWIWYWSGFGQAYRERGPEVRTEAQNIYSISLDFQSGPYEISENGGAYVGKWSPDNRFIAYSDYDENHIHQVFVTTFEGKERFKLTGFHEISQAEQWNKGVLSIDWSPDGKRIAVTHYENYEPQVMIYDLMNIKEPYQIENSRSLWWLDSNRLVGYSENTDFQGISVFDVSKEKLEYIISESEYPHIQHIDPYITENVIGFFSWKDDSLKFYTYNDETETIENLTNIEGVLDMVYWVASPSNFPGKDVCNEKPILENAEIK